MPTTAPESAALVALLRVGRRPWHVYAELVEEAGSARAVLDRELEADEGGQTTLAPSDPEPHVNEAAADIDNWTAAGIRTITVLDPGYPENLGAVHDRPPVIFVAGELLPRDVRSVAVIGTRRPSADGLETATAIAHRLATSGLTVVSGLAAGVDTAVHEATLEAGGRTVAVIGTGLHHSYPPQNAQLQRRIAQTCAAVSQFWPDAPPRREAFPERNATMSGLTLATVIVEASQMSGARIQARRALAHGRPVLLARQTLVEPWAREFARRPGTHVIGSPAEIEGILDRLSATGTLTE
jgi:DNA processing protein